MTGRKTLEEFIFVVVFLVVAAWAAWVLREPVRAAQRLAREEATCLGLHSQVPQLYWDEAEGMCLWRSLEEVAADGHSR